MSCFNDENIVFVMNYSTFNPLHFKRQHFSQIHLNWWSEKNHHQNVFDRLKLFCIFNKTDSKMNRWSLCAKQCCMRKKPAMRHDENFYWISHRLSDFRWCVSDFCLDSHFDRATKTAEKKNGCWCRFEWQLNTVQSPLHLLLD